MRINCGMAAATSIAQKPPTRRPCPAHTLSHNTSCNPALLSHTERKGAVGRWPQHAAQMPQEVMQPQRRAMAAKCAAEAGEGKVRSRAGTGGAALIAASMFARSMGSVVLEGRVGSTRCVLRRRAARDVSTARHSDVGGGPATPKLCCRSHSTRTISAASVHDRFVSPPSAPTPDRMTADDPTVTSDAGGERASVSLASPASLSSP
mmetsp:Transcript_66155/g.144531  ORF Transcript_66155/g.144531 Transcript_66155/m.144531 type:complete len:206 (-) Transcript_66155:976-1593(-)